MNADLPPELQTVCIGDLARLCKHQDRDNVGGGWFDGWWVVDG